MGFFDEIIDPAWLAPSPTALPEPPWLGPPHDVRAIQLPIELDFVRTSDLALWISGATVFPSGITFDLQVRWGRARRVALPLLVGDRGRGGLCLGVAFDDGRRALAVPRRRQLRQREPQQSLVATTLRARPYQTTNEIWMWPLPAESLTWVLEWRAQQVAESRVRFTADGLADAARRARPVWSVPAPAVN